MARKLFSKRLLLISFGFLSLSTQAKAEESVARMWNEALLEAIRGDFARPTVHARNLFHLSIALYDSWAIYDSSSSTYFLAKTVHGFPCPFNGVSYPPSSQKQGFQEEAMSYAAFRLLMHRFANSPGADSSLSRFRTLFSTLGYDESFTSTDYATDGPPAVGNYLAQQLIAYGLQDGSNEANDYRNRYYLPINQALAPVEPGNPGLNDPNRWQPLALDTFVDQSGNVLPGNIPDFLSPEWGEVDGFALADSVRTVYRRGNYDYEVFHDRGAPPYLDTLSIGGLSEEYKWNFALVSKWSSHLDPGDSTVWDISPASIGNVQDYPAIIPELRDFYDEREGGDPGRGRSMNPITNSPYQPQLVLRADYTRVLAEFWADGPDSETPPGHWFTILNYVNDDSLLIKKFKGEGPILSDLEWDVKAYFCLSGALHDAAITAWGNKGWYDYIRPISAIRYMADKGQSSDPFLPAYHPAGIPLDSGFIELVSSGDPLAGDSNQHINKIKVKAWRGPDYISDPKTDSAGVDWILAENWWPYQRPTFITPNFAGYVSGHSTFSRAAAEAITYFTGDEYFPGGMGEFFAPKDSFLVFEKGPSVDITLQWATYRDASDQCSLSRIWGGIHPPADDIPGRLMGIELGRNAFKEAEAYFNNQRTELFESLIKRRRFTVYPNPITDGELSVELDGPLNSSKVRVLWLNLHGKVIREESALIMEAQQTIRLRSGDLSPGVYLLQFSSSNWSAQEKVIIQ